MDGFHAFGGSSINANASTATNCGGTAYNAGGLGRLNAHNSNAGGTTYDYSVYDGGQVGMGDPQGGTNTNITPNTITGDGIIFN